MDGNDVYDLLQFIPSSFHVDGMNFSPEHTDIRLSLVIYHHPYFSYSCYLTKHDERHYTSNYRGNTDKFEYGSNDIRSLAKTIVSYQGKSTVHLSMQMTLESMEKYMQVSKNGTLTRQEIVNNMNKLDIHAAKYDLLNRTLPAGTMDFWEKSKVGDVSLFPLRDTKNYYTGEFIFYNTFMT